MPSSFYLWLQSLRFFIKGSKCPFPYTSFHPFSFVLFFVICHRLFAFSCFHWRKKRFVSSQDSVYKLWSPLCSFLLSTGDDGVQALKALEASISPIKLTPGGLRFLEGLVGDDLHTEQIFFAFRFAIFF